MKNSLPPLVILTFPVSDQTWRLTRSACPRRGRLTGDSTLALTWALSCAGSEDREGPARQASSLRIDRGSLRGQPVLRLAGELDVWTAPELREALGEGCAQCPSLLIVDLSAVHYLDATGIGNLFVAKRRMVAADGDVLLIAPQLIDLVLALTGLGSIFRSRPDEASLLAFLDAEATSRRAG